ncbi:MAG: asparagine synthase (glutamine-hydrolyzing) [Aureispira sp.]
MCRIVGFWDFNHEQAYPLSETLVAMRDSLQHGGPDSAGAYQAPDTALVLGHRRLSILDLSAAGQQPMYWQDWVLVFNGEIYNFKVIRQTLERLGYSFETETDSEVLLKAFQEWGQEMVSRFRGFFAFAIYNQQSQELTLCRDRFGVKPLYWYWKEGLFMFASELKAFHQHPQFDKSIAPAAVSLYLQQGYIPHPHCIFEQAHKLSAGHFLTLSLGGTPETTAYWNPKEAYANTTVSQQSEGELQEELEGLLTESFEWRMVADVPVGAFLSGGIDSSIVTALLQKKQGRQLKTFTIGFHDEAYNEAEHAKAVAQHLGTDHQELYCTPAHFKEVIPLLPELYDEPFGDSSCIPTYLVSQMAREQVTVSLSSDGGDEIFGGYTKYEVAKQFYPKIQRLGGPLRSMLRKAGQIIDPLWLERNSHRLPILKNYKNVSNKYPKLLQALAAKDVLDFFNRSSIYRSQQDLARLLPQHQNRYESDLPIEEERLISYLGLVDIETYLEGDIMTKVDRATMAVALEGRDPFLDQQLVEFGMKLPDHLKIQGKDSKYLLRQVLYKYVPKELIERPKQGFSIPVQQWLLGHLQPALLALKEDQAFAQVFQMNLLELQQIIDNFLAQKRYVNPHFIWFLYTLHQWYERWIKSS